MNASKTNLVAVLTTTAVLLIASASFAKNNSNNTPSRSKKEVKNFTSTSISNNSIGLSHGNNFISDPGKKKTIHGTILGTNLGNTSHLSGNTDGKFKIKNGSNTSHSNKPFKWHNKFWYCDHSHHIVFVDHFVEPVFANYVVVPGDTFEVISLKLFHTSGHTLFLASLNRLPVNTLLIPGQVLVVPAF